MRLGLPLRPWLREFIITGTTALHLDTFARTREQARAATGPQPIRVLFLHATPDPDALKALLEWLQRHFEIIDFATFDRRMRSAAPSPVRRPAVLLTFDDGFESNYRVAAPLLEAAGARGLFFVVPGFSVLHGDEARRFYVEHIRGARFAPPMTPEQVGDLAARGHTIGNHTFSHALLSRTPANEYDREIDHSAARIESWTGRRVEAFAWPFVWNGLTSDAYAVVRARHSHCFSPCAGCNVPGADVPGLIWRTNVETWSRSAERRFQCSTLADRASADRRWRLRQRLHPLVPPTCQAA